MNFLNANFFELIIIILIALSIHECAHALTAHWLGDDTAKNQGRMTLNPLKHLDPIGTILFLVIGIGWGKPVPINPSYFKNPRQGQALVALAGPVSNILLASLLGIFMKFTGQSSLFLNLLIEINIVLAAFNLLPLPPLDGSKILGLILPSQSFYKITEFTEKNLGYIILIFFLDIQILGPSGNSIFLNIIQFLTIAIKTLILI